MVSDRIVLYFPDITNKQKAGLPNPKFSLLHVISNPNTHFIVYRRQKQQLFIVYRRQVPLQRQFCAGKVVFLKEENNIPNWENKKFQLGK